MIAAACTIAVMATLLSSCGNEYSDMKVPLLNKDLVVVTGKVAKDTIYSMNGVNFNIGRVWIEKSDGTSYIDTQKNNRNEISDGQNIIGKIEYAGDEISKIEIPDWCVITRFKKKKKQYAYAIEALGRKDLHMSLILPYAGGSIEIK
ncbi:hypothetical protein C3V39_06995 [Prevotella sp. oral taxon 820]|nr:hypothetical protein C3V39_06995 [Prevotella sp. oral taxon 820]